MDTNADYAGVKMSPLVNWDFNLPLRVNKVLRNRILVDILGIQNTSYKISTRINDLYGAYFVVGDFL